MAQARTKTPAAKKTTTSTTKRPAKGAAPSSKRPSRGAAPTSKRPSATSKRPAAKGAAPAATKAPRKKPVAVAPPVLDRAAQQRESARELAKWIAAAGIDRKAERIEIIDVGEKVDYADFIVLMSGRSDRQVRSIAEGVAEALRERGVRATNIEGLSQGHWVLVDFSDVVVHVFLEEARSYYDLESLWMDARRVPVEGAVLPPVKKPDGAPTA